MDTDFTLKALQRHFGVQPNFSEHDYLHSLGSGREAILYSFLFLPKLVEIDNSIFLSFNVYNRNELESALASAKTNLQRIDIEKSYNWIEIDYAFSTRDLTLKEGELLALRLRDAWDGWLKVQYPERIFVVELTDPEDSNDSVGVQFYEQRKPLDTPSA